jgi:hypothetical protein
VIKRLRLYSKLQRLFQNTPGFLEKFSIFFYFVPKGPIKAVMMKKLVLAVFCMVILGGFGFGQITDVQGALDAIDDLKAATNKMEDMIDSFIGIFPDVATQQNVEPKAWIGYLIQNPYPEITKKSGKTTKELPHFTIGVNTGVGLMSTGKINEVGKILNDDDIIPFPMMPWPSITADIRIGGIKTSRIDLPFDLGFSFFTLDLGPLVGIDDFGLQWTNWGLDARYLLIRQNGAIPNVSANAGFAHWSLNLDTEVFDAELSTNTIYFGGQASYTLGGFFIPYLGLKMLTGKNKGTVTLTVPPEYVSLVEAANYESSKTMGPEKSFFQLQFFGGFGIDWLVFETSIGGSINVFTRTPGLNVITRFSL